MKKTSYFLLISLSMIACKKDQPNKAEDSFNRTLDSLSTALELERKVSDSLELLVSSKDTIDGYPIFFGNKYEGIEDPEEFIINQLRNQPEIIPLSPVVGGNMAFRKIEVISEKWVLAIYDDGHIQGKAILEYQLQPNGSVKYTMVATQE